MNPENPSLKDVLNWISEDLLLDQAYFESEAKSWETADNGHGPRNEGAANHARGWHEKIEAILDGDPEIWGNITDGHHAMPETTAQKLEKEKATCS